MIAVMVIGGTALTTTMLPHFSKMVAKDDWHGIRTIFKKYSYLTLLAALPITIILFLSSEFLVKFIYERGAFTAANTQLVSTVQGFYLLQLPFHLLGILGVRLINALKKNHILMYIAGISLVANVVGNYILLQIFGVAGISLSTSIVYAISALLIYLALHVQLKRKT